MTRTVLVRASAVTAVLLLGAWAAFTQPPAAKNHLNKIANDLYEIEGNGGNVAVYITDEGVILVDDKFDADFADIMALVKTVTDKPIKYVLNTHHHGDHTGSNAKFISTAEIISTAAARKNMIDGKQSGAPRVVFTQETSVFLGGKEVRARYYGRGHTNGDAVIFFPALRVVHTGDLVAGNSPLVDYGGGGSIVDWTGTLDEVLKIDFDTLIPGHGPVGKKADVKTYRDNVAKLRGRVSGLVKEGKSKDDVAKVLTAEFGWDPKGLQMTRGLDGIMNELK